jgi:hypothetical protein
VVAGYIASSFQWSRFGEQWDKLLRKWGIPIDPRYGIRLVHRNKLEHLQGDFKNWTEPDRDRFLEKAYAIVRRHTRIPIGNAVARKDFETIALKPMQKIMGGAYGWCAYTCIHQVKQHCVYRGYKDPVNFVFEMGAPGRKQLNQLFIYLGEHQQLQEYYQIGSISFETKKVRPLQPADFLAYDLGRFFLDYKIGRTRPTVNTYLRELVGPVKPEDDRIAYWDEKSLEGHAKVLDEAGLFQGQSLLVPTSTRVSRK